MSCTATLNKICPRCKKELPESDFHADSSKKDGLHSCCRKCASQYHKEYSEINRNKISQQRKQYVLSKSGKRAFKKYAVSEKGRAVNKRYRDTINGHLRRIFNNLRYRCDNPTVHNYARYGGRGIQNKFKSSDEFVSYIVDELKIDPRGLQIDRVDNNGHYEKGNIRFVTAKENCNNRGPDDTQ